MPTDDLNCLSWQRIQAWADCARLFDHLAVPAQQSCSRLRELCQDDWQIDRVSVHFSRSSTGVVCVQGECCLQLTLQCQRCMETMAWPLNKRFAWQLLPVEQFDEQMSGDVVEVSAKGLNLWQCLEDEVFLSIPLAPVHTTDCQRAGTMKEEKRRYEDSPFAVLKKA